MITRKMFKFFLNFFIINLIVFTNCFASDNFQNWLKNFQTTAIESGISENVVKDVMTNAKYLPKVIEYDRYQPNFMRILSHIKKRSSTGKLKRV